MILKAFAVAAFFIFWITLLNALPDATNLSPAIQDSLHMIFGMMQTMNFLIPIQELAIVVGLQMIIESALWGWSITKWLLGIMKSSLGASA